MAGDHLSTGTLFEHVQDGDHFYVPRALVEDPHGRLYIPQPFFDPNKPKPIYEAHTGNAMIDRMIEPLDLKLTKFMVIEVIVGLILCVVFIRLALRMRGGERPRGRMWNMLEAMLLFIRDEVARPAIGTKDADRYLPFLWTIFFFVLGCNLFGMIPWMGSPTGALATTGALAIITFITVIGTGMVKFGVVGFFKSLVPHMDLPLVLAIVLMPMIFCIEVLGLCIKHFVLAIRLLANMMAGHVVLAVIVAFIAITYWNTAGTGISMMWYGVMPASVLGATALSLLELFVAFLQAYIFVFLSALFIGMAAHPH